MKSFVLISILFVFTSISKAQNIPHWPEQMEEASYFEVFDLVLKSGQYYKESQVELKAGEGAFFFILAGAFLPQIYITDTLMQNWSTGIAGEFSDGIYISKISFIPKSDTIIKVIFSTVDKYITGDYIYGYRILSADQMHFESSYSYCDKLAYLISNWQSLWGLVSIQDFTPNGELGKASANNSVVKGGIGALQINGITDYHEILYKFDNAEMAKNKYEEVVANTISCLKAGDWYIIPNVDPEIGGVSKTDFIIKGASVKDPTGSFVISQSCDEGMGCNVYIDFY